MNYLVYSILWERGEYNRFGPEELKVILVTWAITSILMFLQGLGRSAFDTEWQLAECSSLSKHTAW